MQTTTFTLIPCRMYVTNDITPTNVNMLLLYATFMYHARFEHPISCFLKRYQTRADGPEINVTGRMNYWGANYYQSHDVSNSLIIN